MEGYAKESFRFSIRDHCPPVKCIALKQRDLTLGVMQVPWLERENYQQSWPPDGQSNGGAGAGSDADGDSRRRVGVPMRKTRISCTRFNVHCMGIRPPPEHYTKRQIPTFGVRDSTTSASKNPSGCDPKTGNIMRISMCQLTSMTV